MMTALRIYTATGLLGTVIFGSIMVWADNRHIEKLRRPANLLTLLSLPALLIAGVIVAAGSIGLG